jgi:hypothetical protein
MEFAVDPLVAAAAEDLESGSNVVIPAPANTVFTYSDEHGTVGWLPHPRLTDSLRNDLTAAVGQSPRAWLSLFRLKTANCLTNRSTPLLACKAIHSTSRGSWGRHTVRKSYWCIHHGSDKTRNSRKLSA